jgi:hypothetical protein
VFFSRQERNPAYFKAGDVVTASIATEDGALDLGTQPHRRPGPGALSAPAIDPSRGSVDTEA